MKLFLSWAAKLLVLIVLVQGWFLYDFYRENTLLSAHNKALLLELKDSEEALKRTQAELVAMEERTFNGVLEQTNKAVISGWETLLNKVEDELQRARKAIPELLNPQVPDSRQPKVETPEQELPYSESEITGERT